MKNSNVDRNLYILIISLFAVQLGLVYWNLKEQREWRKMSNNQKTN